MKNLLKFKLTRFETFCWNNFEKMDDICKNPEKNKLFRLFLF